MKLFWKGIWNYKCFCCGEGDLFKKFFKWIDFIDMYKEC